VCETIAERIQTNVRDLEGAFNRIAAESQLGWNPISKTAAEFSLERYERPRHHVSVEQVVSATARHYGLEANDLTGPRRAQRVNQARQVAMYLTREITDASLPQIGEIFGGRSHTTILHGCNKVAEDLETDDILRHVVEKLRKQLVKERHSSGPAQTS